MDSQAHPTVSMEFATNVAPTAAARAWAGARPCRLRSTCLAAELPPGVEADEELEEETDRRSTTTAWWVAGGALALGWFVVTSGKADALIYMLQCALAG